MTLEDIESLEGRLQALFQHIQYLREEAKNVSSLDRDVILEELRRCYSLCLPKQDLLAKASEAQAPPAAQEEEQKQELSAPQQDMPEQEQEAEEAPLIIRKKRIFVFDSEDEVPAQEPQPQKMAKPVQQEPKAPEPQAQEEEKSLEADPEKQPQALEKLEEQEKKSLALPQGQEPEQVLLAVQEEENSTELAPQEEQGFDADYDELFAIKAPTELSERLSQSPIKDIGSKMGLNERMLYISQLFGGDANDFSDAIHVLNGLDGFEQARGYLEKRFAQKEEWLKKERKHKAKEFLKLVNRRYL